MPGTVGGERVSCGICNADEVRIVGAPLGLIREFRMEALRIPRHFAAVALALPLTLIAPSTQGDSAAQRLAEQAMKASGADHWSSVKRIVFTFNVAQDGKTLLSAKHDWDLTKGTD